MTHQQHAREAEAILALADDSSTDELLTAICHTLMGLYWQREATRAQETEDLWRTCAGARPCA